MAAATQASKQSATKKVSQLSVVKKWASWIDIGARAAKSAAMQTDCATGEGGTEGGDGEYRERAQGGGDGPSHEVGAVHGVPVGAGESGKRPGGRVGHPEREGAVGELAELAGWLGRPSGDSIHCARDRGACRGRVASRSRMRSMRTILAMKSSSGCRSAPSSQSMP